MHADRRARRALALAADDLAGVSDTPRLDAELLMAHAMGVSRETLLLSRLDTATPAAFGPMLLRRLSHEPVAYITGTRAFWTIDLMVGPGVLIPRADSETLIEAAIARFGERGPATILDLGTGPGTLLLAALDQWLRAHGLGVDRSPAALAMARANAVRLGHGARAQFAAGNWAQAIDRRFDLILSNPPYIGSDETLPPDVCGHEPAEALFAGPDGLDAYRAIIPDLARLRAPGGVAILEIGHRQANDVGAIAAAAGWQVALRHDLAGRPRALVLS